MTDKPELTEMDLTEIIPAQATAIILHYLIKTPGANILVYKSLDDTKPVVLDGEEGSVTVQLADSAKLYMHIPKGVKHDIGTDGYILDYGLNYSNKRSETDRKFKKLRRELPGSGKRALDGLIKALKDKDNSNAEARWTEIADAVEFKMPGYQLTLAIADLIGFTPKMPSVN